MSWDLAVFTARTIELARLGDDVQLEPHPGGFVAPRMVRGRPLDDAADPELLEAEATRRGFA